MNDLLGMEDKEIYQAFLFWFKSLVTNESIEAVIKPADKKIVIFSRRPEVVQNIIRGRSHFLGVVIEIVKDKGN